MILKFSKQVKLFINLFTFFLFFCATALAQQPIADIKNLPPGSVVTTTGTISTGEEFGFLRYMQDDAAGIAIYSSSFANTQPGDSIIVSGVLSVYQGELQISPVMSYQVISTGHNLNPVLTQNLSSISDPEYSARLLAISCVGINTCEAKFAEGPYTFYDQFGNTRKLIVNEESNLIGQPISSKALVVSGIWTSINGQYQMLAREAAEASKGSCFLIPPATVYFDSNKVKLTWQNIDPLVAYFEYGEDSFNRIIGSNGPDWTFTPTDLLPGIIYQARLRVENNDTYPKSEIRV